MAGHEHGGHGRNLTVALELVDDLSGRHPLHVQFGVQEDQETRGSRRSTVDPDAAAGRFAGAGDEVFDHHDLLAQAAV